MRVTSLLTLLIIHVVVLSISVMRTPHSLIFYPDWLENDAQKLANEVEERWASVTNFFDNDPEHINIFFGFSGTYINGFADPVGKGIVVMDYPDPSKFLNFENWYAVVFTHEFTHICHLTMRNGFPKLFNAVTGVPLLDSEYRSPFVESTTVFNESQVGSGGRLNNPLLDYLMFAAVKGNWLPSLVRLSNPPTEDFLGKGMYYYIPSRFYAYLVRSYGEEKVREFLKDLSGNIAGIGIDSTSKKVFGKNLEELFKEWRSAVKKFSTPEKTIFERKNDMVLDMAKGKNIWIAVRRYGIPVLYGPGGVEVGILSDGKFSEKFRVYNYAGNLRVDEGKVYYLVHITKGTCCGFPYLENAIAVWNGGEKILKEGLITSFDVKDGKIYWSEYNPKRGVSEVQTPNGKIEVKGLVREMVASSKLFLLIYRDGESSVLWAGGEELHDKRFKYSLKRCKGGVCFIGFDKEGADIYIWDKTLKRLTEGYAFLDYQLTDDGILVTSFSTKFPGVGIYYVKGKPKNVEIERVRLSNKSVKNYPAEDGAFWYVRETLKPVVHVPLIFPVNGMAVLSVVLGGNSPDYNLIWAVAPSISERGFDINGFLNFEMGNLQLSGYKLMKWGKIVGRLNLIRERLDSDFLIFGGIFGGYADGYTGGIYTQVRKGFFYGEASVGCEMTSMNVDLSAELDLDYFKVRAEVSYPPSGKLSLSFPVRELDIGTLDPYFHISHIFSTVSLGYGKYPYLEMFAGAEIGDLVTYSRSFPKVGVRISEKNLKFLVDFGI